MIKSVTHLATHPRAQQLPQGLDTLRIVGGITLIGQTDGGLAGLHFSGQTDTDWPTMSPTERLVVLHEYLVAEVRYTGLPDEDD